MASTFGVGEAFERFAGVPNFAIYLLELAYEEDLVCVEGGGHDEG
jgi:hypothetical protein